MVCWPLSHAGYRSSHFFRKVLVVSVLSSDHLHKDSLCKQSINIHSQIESNAYSCSMPGSPKSSSWTTNHLDKLWDNFDLSCLRPILESFWQYGMCSPVCSSVWSYLENWPKFDWTAFEQIMFQPVAFLPLILLWVLSILYCALSCYDTSLCTSCQWLLCPPYHSQPWSGIFVQRGGLQLTEARHLIPSSSYLKGGAGWVLQLLY